ncbi:MAG: B12-binding domain-containing radical SAM protein [Bacteroidia bacterium]|nr:B12-binding domain-containing radical SAM protein [Bacteroidia bacterium]
MGPASRKKIILYNPKAVFFDMPLALMAIGSALDPSRYEVILIDGRLEENALSAVLSHVDDALCLGVTVLTGAPIRDALKISRAARGRNPNLKIVWGGWHPSIFPEAILREEPSVDVTVQGQGEGTFRELVESFAAGELPVGVKGLCYRSGEEIIRNPARDLEDMNALPPVNYNLIEVEKYFRKKGKPQMDYISSTGCFFRCTFCADPFVFSRKFTAIEPERMGEELGYLHKKHGFTDLNFQDETFFTYVKRVQGVSEQLLAREIKTTWAGTMRADQGYRLTDEDFALVKRSGLRRVLIGVESGSQEMMDWLKKDIKIEQVWHSAKRCAELGIGAIFPFIVGFPGETEESVVNSLEMAHQLSLMSPDFTTPIFFFKPYPGSAITTQVVSQGYKLPKTLEEWANFDYVGSSGPWVTPEKFTMIQNFKFYNRLAGRNNPLLLKPLEILAQWRCRNRNFTLPLEKAIANALLPKKELS